MNDQSFPSVSKSKIFNKIRWNKWQNFQSNDNENNLERRTFFKQKSVGNWHKRSGFSSGFSSKKTNNPEKRWKQQEPAKHKPSVHELLLQQSGQQSVLSSKSLPEPKLLQEHAKSAQSADATTIPAEVQQPEPAVPELRL